MESLSEIVGKNLVALRKAKGLTQLQLANEIHYSDKSISKWENGYALPSVDILLDFAKYYGVTVDYLVTSQDDEAIAEAINRKREEDRRHSPNKIVIMVVLGFAILFAASLILISDYINDIWHQPTGGGAHYWPVITWGFVLMMIAETALTHFFYRNKIADVILISLSVWFLIGSFIFHYWFWVGRNVWYVIFSGIPLQGTILAIYFWEKPITKKNKKTPE